LPKESNIYDLVERAAVRRAMYRLDLWKDVLKALAEGELPVLNPEDGRVAWGASQWRASADRGNDPTSGTTHALQRIMVRTADFERWLRKANKIRGPRPGTTGLYAEADRRTFPAISRLINERKAGSAYGAALILAHDGKLAGDNTTPESKAKRVSERYRKERGG
jgi:hypothetical protein